MDANAADASPCSGNGGNCGPNAECKHEVSGGMCTDFDKLQLDSFNNKVLLSPHPSTQKTGELSADTICVCKEGYTGDPDSPEGCSEHDPAHVARPGGQGQLTARGCVTPANNRTYQVGEQWFDACDYSCVCGEEQEIICQVRAICRLY